MTAEEKQAAQALIIDEIQANFQTNPTLLVDALLADQGFAFLHAVLSKRASVAAGAAQATAQLLRAIRPAREPEQEAS